MKRKFIVCLIIALAIMLLFVVKEAFAAECNNSFVSYYMPDDLKLSYKNIDDEYLYSSYRGFWGDSYISTSITITAYKRIYNHAYSDQTELDKRVYNLKQTYSGDDGENFYIQNAELVEINGVQGYRLNYYIKYPADFYEHGYDEYVLRSDTCEYKIEIRSEKEFINSVEYKKFINSFKVKDTVMQTNMIPFNDVTPKNWFYNAVKYTNSNKMILGLNNYTFGPYNKLTRAMLVTILWRMEGQPGTELNKFADVKSEDWYYTAVNWAASNKIVNGYGNGMFGPKDDITREQLSAILMNYATYKNKDISKRADISRFYDNQKVASYFTDAVSWCVANKIISGKENGTKIDPKGSATRAEAASMLMTYCTNIK